MIFTNRGELFCDPEFGGDLSRYLHETRLSAETIESELRSQVREYIVELESINYTLQVNFYEDPERYQEYMEINFQIADYEVYAVVT
jgi:phage baseplate assembly protein W